MTLRRTIMNRSLCVACLFALAVATFAEPPPPEDSRDRSPTAVLAHCIKLLSTEAEESKTDGALARNAPTFVKDSGESLPSQLVLDRIAQRIDNDAFTDAYVRWQLTGFDIPDFAITDLAFDRLLRTLPAFMSSPRADAALIESLNRATQIGRLTPRQQEEANAKLNDLATKYSAAQTLNTLALEFRKWLIERLETSGPDRAILVAMERAASLAAAGWPNEDAKRQVDAMLQKAARTREFTAEQRREVIQRAGKLITTGRMFVASAGVSGEALAVEYATTGIFDFDVRRWEKLLRD